MSPRSLPFPRAAVAGTGIAAVIAGASLVSPLGISAAQAAGSGDVVRMSVAPKAVADASGGTWSARTGFDKGDYSNSFWNPATDIRGTTDDNLYRAEFVRMTKWSNAVPRGTYDVTLKMRESWWNAPGVRVFDVTAEGQRKLTDIDIFKAVGKQTAYDRTFRVSVTDGRLDLGFVAKKDAALVSAIRVVKAGAATAPTPAPTPTPAPKPTTPKPTTPKPTTPPVNTNRPSGLIFDSGAFSMHSAAELKKFEANRGRTSDVIAVFPARASWPAMLDPWWMDDKRIPAGFKGTLNVALPMWPQNGNIGTAASGGYNAQWKQMARLIASKYPTAYVRVGWEMNLPSWYYKATPANAGQWKQAYRQAVTSMRSAAPGLRFVFNPNEGVGQTGTEDNLMFYPGDDVVDIVGIDSYDWWPGFTTDAAIAKHRDGKFGWNYWLDFAKARGKKFALPEWGIAPANSASGGDNPKFINFVYSWLKANQEWIAFENYFQESGAYIRSDLFTGNSPKASAEYKRWMPLLVK